jgi:CspA family cold shock protein
MLGSGLARALRSAASGLCLSLSVGFIRPEDGAEDVFVHISAVESSGLGTFTEGQRVSFDVARNPRTRKAAATNLEGSA